MAAFYARPLQAALGSTPLTADGDGPHGDQQPGNCHSAHLRLYGLAVGGGPRLHAPRAGTEGPGNKQQR